MTPNATTDSSPSAQDCQNRILGQPKSILHQTRIGDHKHKAPRRKICSRFWSIQKSRKRVIHGIKSRRKSRKSRKCSASSIKNFIKKVRSSLDSLDGINEEFSKLVLGEEYGLVCKSPFVLQKLEGNANIVEGGELGIGDVMPVASGVVVRGQFVQFNRGVLINSRYSYYLPIVDNHGFLFGEFSKVDDLSICDIEDDCLPDLESWPDPLYCKSLTGKD